jgi:transposase
MNTAGIFPEVSGQFVCDRKDSCIHVQELLQQKDSLQSDLEQLESVLALGVEEFKNRDKRIAELEEELKFQKEIETENKLLKDELEREKGKVRLLNKLLYGRSGEVENSEPKQDSVESEEVNIIDGDVVDEGGYVMKKTNRGAKEKHIGHGREIPDNLPVEEVIIDLPEDKRRCECCGAPLQESGLEEISSEISVKKYYYVKKIKRKIYKKTCKCGPGLVRTPLSPKLIPRGKFSIEFWVDCFISKYRDHLPVTRQITGMKSIGIEVSSGTIISGFKKIYFNFISALYQAMIEELRKSNHWHADETGWNVFLELEGKTNFRWFMWVFISKDVVVFVPAPTRSAKVPAKVLFNIDEEDLKKLSKDKSILDSNTKPVLNVDEYSGYEALQNRNLVCLSYCWFHQNRKFEDLITKYPQNKELVVWAEMWITKIAELFKVNNERIKYDPKSSNFAIYHKNVKDIINWIEQELEKQYNHQAQIEIINSTKQHWPGLTLFVNHPEIPMTNNISERMLKLVVLGENNYWGSCSIWGANLVAAIHSIIQTCLQNNISPVAYLIYYFEECAKRGSAPDEQEIVSFLPHKLPEDIKKKLSNKAPP